MRRGLRNVIDVLFEQQAVAEVSLDFVELLDQGAIFLVFAQRFQKRDGTLTVDDARFVFFHERIDTLDLLRERTGAHQAEEPGNVNAHGVLAGFFIGDGKKRKRSRRFMRFPHGFHGGNLGGLILRDAVGRFVAHVKGENRGNEAEDGAQTQATLGKADVAPLDEVPSGDGNHKHGASHVTGVDRVHELGLCPGACGNLPEVRHFHAHRLEVELGAGRVHHPGVGNQNP